MALARVPGASSHRLVGSVVFRCIASQGAIVETALPHCDYTSAFSRKVGRFSGRAPHSGCIADMEVGPGCCAPMQVGGTVGGSGSEGAEEGWPRGGKSRLGGAFLT